MTTGLLVILTVGAAFCGWALLAVMGAERQRLLKEQEEKRPGKHPPAATAPPPRTAPRTAPRPTPTKPRGAGGGATAKAAALKKNAR